MNIRRDETFVASFRFIGRRWVALLCVASVLGGSVWPIAEASAERLVLFDGRIVEGKAARLSGMSSLLEAPPPNGAPNIQPIVIIDDDLRRLFIPSRRIQEFLDGDRGAPHERFIIDQPNIRGTRTVAGVGPIINIGQWDEHGRRVFSMNTQRGRADVIQGITEITPRWTKVEALKDVRWDMRIATNSIPRATLHRILSKHIDPEKPDERLKLVRLLLQAERFAEAELELNEIIEQFPDLKDQLAAPARTIKQQAARRLLREVVRLRAAGRHQLAIASLEQFPPEGVSGEILQEVREHLETYRQEQARQQAILERLEVLLNEIADEQLRQRIETVTNEIADELYFNTLRRMVAFEQLQDDATMIAEEKLALAISGWLVGATNSTPNVAVALSLFETRRLIREYLNAPTVIQRAEIIQRIQSEEGGSPRYVAALVEHMRPPVPTATERELAPGFYQLEVAGLTPEPPVTYYVQLPPEYDPYRRYPAVVTLRGAGTTPVHQIDWWCGSPADDGSRNGHAARNGYIVISPAWAMEHQTKYDHSAREHAAVLNPLRDACRRFSIDTDRVFLSGHSMGGNAAWDMALAHPDLWAGAIPIVAVSEKYCSLYWPNAERLPFYVVGGELDGTKSIDNAKDLDRYMTYHFDITVAEYLGRGHEPFFEEVIHLFDWMGRKQRNFFPREFECRSMRSWDNFFWWVELDQLPPRSIVEPHDWPPERNVRAAATSGAIRTTNGVYVKTGAGRTTVWLSPEIVDFNDRIRLQVNATKFNTGDIQPSLEVLLEDVRRRGDRQHPFWAKVQMPDKKIN